MKKPLYTIIAHLTEQWHEMIFLSHYVSEACHPESHSGSHIINTLQYFYRQCQKNQQVLADAANESMTLRTRIFLPFINKDILKVHACDWLWQLIHSTTR